MLLPAHLPGDESKSRGSCDANSVVPVSSQRLTPDFSDSGPETKAVLSPSAARRTAWPAGHAAIAARIAGLSSVSSLGLPLISVLVASSVVHAVGIVGSGPIASQAGGAIGDSVPAVPPLPVVPAAPPPHPRPPAPPVPAAPPPVRPSRRPCRRRRPACPPRRRSCTSHRSPRAGGRNRPSTQARAVQSRSEKARRGTSPVTIARVSPPAGGRLTRGHCLRPENRRCRDDLPCPPQTPPLRSTRRN